MAHGLNSIIKRGLGAAQCKPEGKTGVGSRRIFSPQFKLQVLDSYRTDADCKGNQRATARKYGIHRRQIQKWLQVENVLRSGGANGNGKQPQTIKVGEMSLNGHRQRDDEIGSAANLAGEAARVPASEPPAGWRPHQQAPRRVPDPASPIDLSLKRPLPSPLSSPPAAAATIVHSSPSPRPEAPPRHADVWDLSTTKRKAEDDSGAISKPVKLFKPYLDDLRESGKSRTPPPTYCCQPPPLSGSPDGYYINNNNNVCCDVIKSPDYHPAYSLHELQPKSAYYPYGYYPAALSPTYLPPSYDESSIVHLKHRQSYSLDFKVSTIDQYYQDSL